MLSNCYRTEAFESGSGHGNAVAMTNVAKCSTGISSELFVDILLQIFLRYKFRTAKAAYTRVSFLSSVTDGNE